MSRIGRKKVVIPQGVNVRFDQNCVIVKGPKGELTRGVPREITVSQSDGAIEVKRSGDRGDIRSLHGLVRSDLQNMVQGVTNGFEKVLEITGVGYRASVEGERVHLALGFSHPIAFPIPKGIQVSVDKQTVMTVRGIDKKQVGEVAAKLRALRLPEPYKGKGIKYRDEKILRKEGKTGK